MGEGGGVGEVDVEADEQLEASERGFHLGGVGDADERVPGEHDECARVGIVRKDVVGEVRGGKPSEGVADAAALRGAKLLRRSSGSR